MCASRVQYCDVVRTHGPGFGQVRFSGLCLHPLGWVVFTSHKTQESNVTCFSSSNLEIYQELLPVRWKVLFDVSYSLLSNNAGIVMTQLYYLSCLIL